MICVIALIVFGILGIFSAKYRVIAKEAFDCVFRKLTLRKCDSRLDSRLKSEISGKLMRYWKSGGKFLFRYFEWFSWAFLILTLVTLFFMGQGIYNYALYGNCNGADSTDFCIFDPLGTVNPHPAASQGAQGTQCAVPAIAGVPETLKVPPLIRADLVPGSYAGNKDAKVVMIEFGCYECHFTKQAEPTVKKVIATYGDQVLFVFKDFPLGPTHVNAIESAQAAHCALDQGKYWEYRDYLFANQPKLSYDDLVTYANELRLDIPAFKDCLQSKKYESAINASYSLGLSSGVTVTPTFFIGSQTLVGAKEYGAFEKAINAELGVKTFWDYVLFWN